MIISLDLAKQNSHLLSFIASFVRGGGKMAKIGLLQQERSAAFFFQGIGLVQDFAYYILSSRYGD